ncbi:MAG: hypothetical protein ACLVIR_06580, partial [Clostridium sp.]
CSLPGAGSGGGEAGSVEGAYAKNLLDRSYYTMDCGLFGVRFLFLGHKNGAATPVDYLSAFAADSPFFYVFFNKIMLYFLIGKTVDVH